ncbi:MAG TPA: sigma-54 dependent transcriptional regulator [Burkholderiales bacterium]|nr:sigma-54 dependent transcriptional regulator [Burkholderiales bacterium]
MEGVRNTPNLAQSLHPMNTPPTARKPDLLIVDDDPLISDTLSFVLSRDFNVCVADSRAQARSVLRQLDEPPALALVDLGLPPTPHRPDEGFRLISELIAYSPAIKIVVLSGQSDEANARHARTLGAIEFIAKPADPPVLKQLLLQALRINAAEKDSPVTPSLQGTSAPLEKLRSQIAQFAASPFPVLVHGESGSGKELVARALHERSARAAHTLFALNCAAISPTLVEPTLFGYAKGAFTGAQTARSGYFEDAHDSTLFLDEIGELPLDLQAKLLRVMENGEFQRVGETLGRSSNARVVAATNRDLKQEVRAGRFRADLYHRLSVFTIDVPPLRELGDDRLLLLDHFREFYARQSRLQPFTLNPQAQALWLNYGFPGNVRELRNIVIRLATKCAGLAVNEEQLRAELDTDAQLEPAGNGLMPFDDAALVETARRQLQTARGFSLDETLARWERGYVEAALDLTQGNLARAAKLLGVNRTTLYSRMQNYAADSPDK